MFVSPRGAAALTIAAAAATIALGARPFSHDMPQTNFTLMSTDFADGAVMPAAHALDTFRGQKCGGQNISPTLQWAGAPPAAKSYAIVMHDPDAKVAGGWTHWVIYGMATTVTGLARDAGKVLSPLPAPEPLVGRPRTNVLSPSMARASPACD